MKKIYFLFLISIFIFSTNSFGQVEPRLVEKIAELYVDSTSEFSPYIHQFYSYNEIGDTLSVIKKIYNPEGEIISWNGDFYEYGDRNKKLIKNNKRYNPEVDLWISNNWSEYFYDNNCLKREDIYYNVGGYQRSWYYFVDEDCQIKEKRSTSDSIFNLYVDYIYPDENNSIISSRKELYNDEWKEIFRTELYKNERGDAVEYIRLGRYEDTPPSDTAFFSRRLYEFDYFEDVMIGQVSSKLRRYYTNVSMFTSPFTVAFQIELRFDYEYYCDGSLFKETVSLPWSSKPSYRTLYFYEGRNDCFDFEQDLEMTISPNPSMGKIEIESLIFESGNTELQVFTSSGQLIIKKSIPSRSHSQNVDLNSLENGVYIIHLRSGKHFSTSKLVMTR